MGELQVTRVFITTNRWLARAGVLRASVLALICAISVCAQDDDTRANRLQRQREDKAKQLQPYKRTKLESELFEVKDRRLIERFQAGYKGFHPLLGGLSTGSGFAMGTQFIKNGIAGGVLNFQTSAQASLNGYQKYQLGLSAPHLAKNRAFLGFDFTLHNSPQEDFYGVGSDSATDNRTNYRLETTEYSGSAGVRPIRALPKLEIGGRGGLLNTNVGHGTDKRFPSVEETFTVDTTPGLDRQPHYKFGSAFVKYDFRDQPLNPRSGGYYIAEGGYYHDGDFGAYSFRRWKMEAQQYFPFFNQRRVIAVRGKLEMTDANSDQQIPFYLLPVVGGSEDLRGYREFRYRDRDSLVFNLEYRWEAFSGLDLALFGDAGNVFPKAGDIQLDKLKTSYGLGFRFNTDRSVFWRIDIGFSPEGTRTFVKFNHVF
jgi:outer membrane protein assembly factor BamA